MFLRSMFKGMKSFSKGLQVSPFPSFMYCQNHKSDKCNDPAYTRLLDGNKAFIDQKIAEDPNFFKNLAKGQSPKYLFIGCSDSRVPPNELTGTGPGELFIHRNVANLVVPTDFNVNSVLQFSIDVLKVEHIIVMGHTQCGGIRASVDGQFHGMIDQWLVTIREVYQKYAKELDAIEDFDLRLRRLTEFTVKEQVLNLCKNQFVQKAWARGQALQLHGWICEIESGKIYDLIVNEKELHKHFNYTFTNTQLGNS